MSSCLTVIVKCGLILEMLKSEKKLTLELVKYVVYYSCVLIFLLTNEYAL